MPFLRKAKEGGKRCKMVFDHLIIDGVHYDLDMDDPTSIKPIHSR